MLPVVLWVWYLSLVTEAALIVRLVRWQVQLPLFGAYLCYDLPRWLTLAVLDRWWASTGHYALFWRWTEPVSIVLLWLAAVEAYRQLAWREEPGRAHWMAAVVGLVAVGMLPGAPDGTQAYLAVRGVVAGGAAVALVVALSGRWDLHACILAVFCAVDLITDVSVWLGGRHPRVAEFVILGQTGCLLTWLRYAPILGRRVLDRNSS